MILVTGAAGKTGLAVLRALHARGLAARALVHRPEDNRLVMDAGAREWVAADLRDTQAFADALQGIEVLYLILPNVFHGEFDLGVELVRAAKKAGLSRLVYHSVLYPDIEAMAHHWDKHLLEQHLAQSGQDYTIVQPASYMQNVLGYWKAIKEHGVYKVPYSVQAAFTPVDLEDVAAAAAKVLSEEGHSGASYPLCGPERLSSAQMATQIGQHLGRQVRAEQEDVAAWQARARRQGLTPYALDALSAMFTYYNQHGLAGESKTLETLLGRAPTTFAEFLDRIPS